jgi:hypothetical protein
MGAHAAARCSEGGFDFASGATQPFAFGFCLRIGAVVLVAPWGQVALFVIAPDCAG